MVKMREPVGAGTNAIGANHMFCTVKSVENNFAWVKDQLQNDRKISTTRMFGKGSFPPEVGETWIITSIFGDWMFAVCINPKPFTLPPPVAIPNIQHGTESFTILTGAYFLIGTTVFDQPFTEVPTITATITSGTNQTYGVTIGNKSASQFDWVAFATNHATQATDGVGTFDWIAVEN